MKEKVIHLVKKHWLAVYAILALLCLFLGLFIGYGVSSDNFFLNILNPQKWWHIFSFINA
ncbi:DNA-directed RNA polymerase subunit beta [Aerococcus kribbianus]|uniref:DNA-directed RNA polymerase subunit beta n=1 Tax=Aerococcus kribbianus TaxID=2999064 RepID=A0A9X3FM12_9LACT|nr:MULTISPECIES: DNA-directed RNA polymerase subunit beta [unclassified Aerococcus]MCZ0716970.1 DNA-directed RNA polymerase subunit beta [Aerococcus sp. YH-aer221]MCZ0725258.1 DNA-directed RNA polymerase subunit beta [Aerococcus sp. YH-aer222]